MLQVLQTEYSVAACAAAPAGPTYPGSKHRKHIIILHHFCLTDTTLLASSTSVGRIWQATFCHPDTA